MQSKLRRDMSLALGPLGEEIGARYLSDKGYRVLERGYTNSRGYRLGEIDIIALHRRRIIFVEVKTRRLRPGAIQVPEQNITREKLRRLERISKVYLRERGWEGRAHAFHALAILYDPITKRAQVRHLEDIFL